MKKKKRRSILSGVPLWLWIVIAVSLLIIIALPAILTRSGLIDFSNTGEVGDTIGGIMGPFIAIIAALLTFVAFWVQYEANIKQREDIAIERHEDKYYKMLDIYFEITKSLDVHGVRGKEAFAELVGEFTYTFFTIDKLFDTVLCSQQYLNKAQHQVKSIIQHFVLNKKDRYTYITNLSYNLFFYGKHYMVVDIEHPERTALGEEIKRMVFNLNNINCQRTYADYVKTAVFEIQNLNAGLLYRLLEGHSDFLGHYFRHLFQMVKYVSSLDDSLFDENDKAGYVKLLRSQMSDYEQILLYYNSLTVQGDAWNRKHGERFPEDAGFIARFRMIKNLPPNFPVFGVLPQIKYMDDSKRWEELGKKFYEHAFLPISNRAEALPSDKSQRS